MSSSIFRRRLVSQISRSCISPPCRNFGSGGHRELSSSPWLMLPPSFKKRWLPACFGKGGQMAYNFYNPVNGKVVSFKNRGGKQDVRALQEPLTKLVGLSHGWLAWSNVPNHHLFLSNPLSGRRIELPPLHWRPSKVILSCSPDKEGECCALMIPSHKTQVAFCRPGRSTKWTVFGEQNFCIGDWKIYSDFVYSPVLNCFVGYWQYYGSCDGCLEYWDIGDPSSCPRMVGTRQLGQSMFSTVWNWNRLKETYLLSSMNRLFLARRFIDTGDFFVYRVDDVEEGGIVPCLSLDDLAMFVGINYSLAVKASEFPKVEPNSIYFGGARYPYLNRFDIQKYDYPSRFRNNHGWPLPWFTFN